MTNAVHMVMGQQEATVIGAALALFLAKVEFDLERWQDTSESDQNEFMAMLSIKFCAEHMFQNLSELLEVGNE